MTTDPNYTCNVYRQEMRLLGLKMRLRKEALGRIEKEIIEAEIAELEKTLELD